MSAARTPGLEPSSSALPEILPARNPELYVIVPRSLLGRLSDSITWLRESTVSPKAPHRKGSDAFDDWCAMRDEHYFMAQKAQEDAQHMLASDDALPELVAALHGFLTGLSPIVNEFHNGKVNGGWPPTRGDMESLAKEITRLAEPARAALAKAGA